MRVALLIAVLGSLVFASTAWGQQPKISERVHQLLKKRPGLPGRLPAADLPALLEAFDSNWGKQGLFHEQQSGVCSLLARIGEPAVAPMVERLKFADAAHRSDAAMVLGNIGPAAKPAVPELIKMFAVVETNTVPSQAARALADILRDEPQTLLALLVAERPSHRRAGVWAAGAFEGDARRAAIPKLIECLKDADETVRHMAANALACYGPDSKAAVPALILGLEQGELDAHAVVALGMIGDPAGIPEVIKHVGLGNDWPQRCAAEALRRFGAAGGKALAPKLEDGVTRRAALEVYQWLPAPPEALGMMRELLAQDRDVEPVLEALATMGPSAAEAAPEVLPQLENRSSDRRRAAMRALGEIRGDRKRVAEELLKRTTGKDPREAEYAAQALARLQGPGHDALLKMLDEKDEARVNLALKALADAGEATAPVLPVLWQRFEERKPRGQGQWIELRHTITWIGPDALPLLMEAAKSPRAETRELAWLVIADIGWKKKGPFNGFWDTGEYVGRSIYPPRDEPHIQPRRRPVVDRDATLAKLVPMLIDRAFTSGPGSLDRAAEMLAHYAPEAPLAVVKEAQSDSPSRRRRAHLMLAELTSKLDGEPWGAALQETLIAALTDSDEEIRDIAIQNLPETLRFFPPRLESKLTAALEKVMAEPNVAGLPFMLEQMPDLGYSLAVRALEQGNEHARARACDTLSRLPPDIAAPALPQLRKARADASIEVRREAEAAVRKLEADAKKE